MTTSAPGASTGRHLTFESFDQPAIEIDDPDIRMRCLRRCVATKFSDEDRRLVVTYYDTKADEKAKTARRRLAESFGLTLNALKVRAGVVRTPSRSALMTRKRTCG